MEFKNLIITSLLIGLFLVAMISFGVQLAADNDTRSILLENEALNKSYTDVQEQLETAEAQTEAQRQGFFEDIPVIGEITLILKSIPSTVRVFFTMGLGVFTTMFSLLAGGLGVNPVIIGVFASIFLVVAILLGWKLLRTGT